MSISFDPSRSPEPLADLADQTGEISRLLVGLESGLRDCGVSQVRRADAAAVAGMVRAAFDPAARGDVQRAAAHPNRDSLLAWGEAGPVGHEEAWRHYTHDSGTSVVWGWHEAPRSQVTAQVLTRLLTPGRHPRRVTLLYRPYPAAEAAQVLEGQVNAAAFRDQLRRSQGRDPSAREHADRDRADQAAREEAAGAGLVRVALYVTATVVDAEQLAAAVAATEAAAGQSRIRLRRLAGSQLAGFCAGLPCGVNPAQLATRNTR